MFWAPLLSMIGNIALKNNSNAQKVLNTASSVIRSDTSINGYNPTDKNQEKISELIKRSGI